MSRPAKSLPIPAQPPPVKAFPSVSVADIKKFGWRSVVDLARKSAGPVTVTNHSRSEAVVLTPEAYAVLLHQAREQTARHETSLEKLTVDFDERLASLQGAQAAARLRSAIAAKPLLRGKVKAGSGY